MLALLFFVGFVWLVVDLAVHTEKWKGRAAPWVPLGKYVWADAKAVGKDIHGLLTRINAHRKRRLGEAMDRIERWANREEEP